MVIPRLQKTFSKFRHQGLAAVKKRCVRIFDAGNAFSSAEDFRTCRMPDACCGGKGEGSHHAVRSASRTASASLFAVDFARGFWRARISFFETGRLWRGGGSIEFFTSADALSKRASASREEFRPFIIMVERRDALKIRALHLSFLHFVFQLRGMTTFLGAFPTVCFFSQYFRACPVF
jgi:hypothetical protein